MTCQSDEENNDNCHSDASSENSSTSCHHSLENTNNDLLWKNNSLSKSYASIVDLFAAQNKSDQQSYPNVSTMTISLLRAEESSIIMEPTPVPNNIDSIIDNGRIQTIYSSSTNFDNNVTNSHENDLYSFILNTNEFNVEENDSTNHQSSIHIINSQTSNKQIQFAKSRIEESSIISDDENTFNILLQLTESYPDIKQCPFLQSLNM